MCGRFTQYFSWSELVACYRLTGLAKNIEPRYNIAPTEDVVVIRSENGGRFASPMRWGLVPKWWRPGDGTFSLFNARVESVDTKTSFRSAFEARRCIVPMSGFYEWRRQGKSRVPFYFSDPEGAPLSAAGLWEEWEFEGQEIVSCTILTVPANDIVAPVHDRMPALVGSYDAEAWLSGRAGKDLLRPAPQGWLRRVEVSPRVNKTGSSSPGDPDCIKPVSAGEG